MTDDENKVLKLYCHRCGGEWTPRLIDRLPTVCPKCCNPNWNKPLNMPKHTFPFWITWGPKMSLVKCELCKTTDSYTGINPTEQNAFYKLFVDKHRNCIKNCQQKIATTKDIIDNTKENECKRCGYPWKSRTNKEPKCCPHCGTYQWKIELTNRKRMQIEHLKVVSEDGTTTNILNAPIKFKELELDEESDAEKEYFFDEFDKGVTIEELIKNHRATPAISSEMFEKHIKEIHKKWKERKN